MSFDFINKVSFQDITSMNLLTLGAKLPQDEITRLSNYATRWNFYEGYHWQNIPPTGKTEVTKNYCRAFVNKFVAFELGSGFSIKMKPEVEESILPFLNEVWDDNKKLKFCQQLGQSKSVTGDAFAQVIFEPKYFEDGKLNPNFYDPFDEYEKGRIRIILLPPNICFPEYDTSHDKDNLIKFTVMYPISVEGKRNVVYKQIWTTQTVEIYHGDERIGVYKNKYNIIPFFHCKNLELVGKTYGVSDLEDLIPLNTELNLKSSDVSEIIEYHSAPVTLVYGARIGQLEKGANKVWGGLPKDARVENLSLEGDLQASKDYIAGIKEAMHEIGGVPEGALGKAMAISNTSGVALQLMMLPLIERIKQKRALTSEFLQNINKLIIKIGLEEGLLTTDLSKWRKGDRYSKDIYYNEIVFEDNLPKDKLVEVQTLQLEMKLGLADREEGMKRLGKDDIQQRLKKIDEDRKNYPEIYGLEVDENGNIVTSSKAKHQMTRDLGENKAGNDSQVNSGYTNSPEKKMSTNS